MLNPSFAQSLNGRFDGMIRVTDVRTLEQAVAHRDGWYLIEPGQDFPDLPVNGRVARNLLHDLVEEILREEDGVWTTMVYVQSAEDPQLIKVFHPRRAGCGCGGSGGIIPWWVLSRLQPEPVQAWVPTETCSMEDNRPWWRRIA